MTPRIEIIAVTGIPEVRQGDDAGALVFDALRAGERGLEDGDVVVVAQKIVSKAEGAVVDLATVRPSPEAAALAEATAKDPRVVEVVLRQSARVIKAAPGVLITETIHGLVCANAGVDSSNAAAEGQLMTLPADPDRSAAEIRESLERRSGSRLAVIVSDSFGRPWREGSTNVAVGVSGLLPLDDARGRPDDSGRTLRSTVVAVADEIAAAAQLVMGEYGRRPAAIVRGARVTLSNQGNARLLQRDPAFDLFR